MPVGWVAGAALVGGAIQADAAGDAADAQRQGARDASAVSREMFDISRRGQMPFMESGYGANAELSRLLGIAPQTAGGEAAGTPTQAEQWNANTGVRMGNTYLPPGATAVSTDGGRGKYYDVMLNGERVGGLVPGGPSGRFISSGAKIPTPRESFLSEQTSSGSPGNTIDMVRQPDGSYAAGGGTGGTGLPTGYLTQTFGPEQFRAGIDPGYQWRQQQGAQNVMNTAAAGSGALSGPALRALMEAGQGMASQEFGSAFDRFQTQQGNIFQRLSSLAALGQNAAAGVGNQAVATGSTIGGNITGAANAEAAGRIGQANAIGGGLSDAASAYYLYGGRRP